MNKFDSELEFAQKVEKLIWMFKSSIDPQGCFSVERRLDRCRVLNISSPPPHATNELTLTHASFISAKGWLSGCWLGGAINQFSFQMSIMQPPPKLHSSLWTSHGCLRISHTLKHRCAHLWCTQKDSYIYIYIYIFVCKEQHIPFNTSHSKDCLTTSAHLGGILCTNIGDFDWQAQVLIELRLVIWSSPKWSSSIWRR